MSTFYEERRKDKAAEAEARIKARAVEREQDRADREAERRARREEQAEARREADRRRREKQKRREERRAKNRERRAESMRKIAREGDTVAALVVMACSIAPAVYFQLAALLAVPGLPGIIAVCLAVMLEAGAWVATVAGERAKREGRPAGKFRVAMWGCASVAAAINYSHAPTTPGNWLAYVLAAASLGGVFFWELRGAGRHPGKGRRTRAERREAAARRRHELARRLRFRDVHKRYRQIVTAHPFGTVDRERAWADAWLDVKGAPLGTDATVIDRRLSATRSVEDVLDGAGVTPEAAAVEQLLADLFGTGRGDDDTPGGGVGGPSTTGPRGPVGGVVLTAPTAPSADRVEDAAPLGRKGLRAPHSASHAGTGRTAPKVPERPLDPAHIDAVRALAEQLGGPDKLSVRKIRRAGVGGADAYLVRLRDHVQGKGGERP